MVSRGQDSKRQHRHQRGAALIEMTLVGVGLIFVMISIFEISRGMWMYHTTAHAVREGVRFAAVHGRNCDPAEGLGNNCLVTVAQIAQTVRNAGAGLIPTETTLTLISPSGAEVSCLLTDAGTPASGCDQNTGVWPPSGDNGTGLAIEMRLVTTFNSALAMFWPGAGPGVSFSAANLGASSVDVIQF